MKPNNLAWLVLAVALATVTCDDPTLAPDAGLVPSLHRDGNRDRAVVVDPDGRHDATTIQAGIDMAPDGGVVRVMPGTYAESLLIIKGLTIEAAVGRHGDHSSKTDKTPEALIVPPGTPAIAVRVATPAPVTIRGISLQFSGANGINGLGVVDLTVEEASVVAVNPPLGVGTLVAVLNDAPTTGRARLVVRNSFIDGAVPFADSPTPAFAQNFGVRVQGDVDAVVDGNVIRRSGGACINVQARNDLAGQMQVDIIDNDVDECYPIGRAGSITVAPANANVPTATRPVTATGTVNIVGNTIRNSLASSLPSTAIFGGRIERNRIMGVVRPGAIATVRGGPGAILLGDQRDFFPPTGVTVRFNDITGNAQAGLRVGRHETSSLDARCNWWGAADGPSGVASGTGDAVVVEAGAAPPVLAPFATTPVARQRRRGMDQHGRHTGHGCRVEFPLWSAPVNLGTAINTPASERNPSLSPDELSLYFASDRAGGQGLTDLYVSRRASSSSPWGTPVNLGPVINTTGEEGGASISSDGHLLYFFVRPAAGGGSDIFVAHRNNVHDDLAWEAPVNLGPYVNTDVDESGSKYVAAMKGRPAALYFNTRPGGATGPFDIYFAPLGPNGLPLAPATPIAELNTVDASDFSPEVSSDGLTLVLTSNRAGTFGNNDLWVATRARLREAWSTPETLGAPVNNASNDRQASLSSDRRTLIFASNRTGGRGSDDLWISVR
jgi:hypothetical protein